MLAPLLMATSRADRASRRAADVLDAGDRERAGGLGRSSACPRRCPGSPRRSHRCHQHDLIDVAARQRERLLADAAHRDAVGEHADAIERDALARLQRFVHRRRILRLDADDLDRGYSCLM
jgi:hypothetical protein